MSVALFNDTSGNNWHRNLNKIPFFTDFLLNLISNFDSILWESIISFFGRNQCKGTIVTEHLIPVDKPFSIYRCDNNYSSDFIARNASGFLHLTLIASMPMQQPRRLWVKLTDNISDSKVHGANMGRICGRQDPGGPHDGPWTLLSRTFTTYPNNMYTK